MVGFGPAQVRIPSQTVCVSIPSRLIQLLMRKDRSRVCLDNGK